MGWIAPWRCRKCGPATASSRRGSSTSPEGCRHRRWSWRAPRARGSGTWTAGSTSTSPAASAARTSATVFPPAVAAIHDQVDRYLHQCFMVGMYEPYIEVCRRLAELSPCRGDEQRSLLVNSGAEAVENAVKIARAATGRPAVIVFDDSFHGRTLLTMTMTSKVVVQAAASARSRPRSTARPGRTRTAASTRTQAIAGLEQLFQHDVDPESVACVVLEPVQGEGGFIVMPDDFPRALREVCDRHGILYVDDEVQSGVGRTGPGLGDRALGRRARPARLRQVARRRAAARGGHGPRGGDGRAGSRRARRHVRRQPRRVRRRERRCSTRSRRPSSASARSSSARSLRTRLDEHGRAHAADRRGARHRPDARARARARPRTRRSRRRELAKATTTGARERGLILLSLRALRQRPPDPRPARSVRRRARTAASRSWRRRLATLSAERANETSNRAEAASEPDVRLVACASSTATSSRSTASTSTSRRGEFFTMLGPSGSGKTTTLRLIAGFERPDAGRVRLGGDDVTRRPAVRARRQHRLPGLRALPAHDGRRERRVRPARQGRPRSAERRAASSEALEMVRLDGLRRRASPRSSPAASASASRSRARSSTARACCCSTSRSARST